MGVVFYHLEVVGLSYLRALLLFNKNSMLNLCPDRHWLSSFLRYRVSMMSSYDFLPHLCTGGVHLAHEYRAFGAAATQRVPEGKAHKGGAVGGRAVRGCGHPI